MIFIKIRAKFERESGTIKVDGEKVKKYGLLLRNYMETGPAFFTVAKI